MKKLLKFELLKIRDNRKLKKKVLLICGSINQTTQMHQIGENLKEEYECYYTPYYGSGYINMLVEMGYLNFSILGKKMGEKTLKYLIENNLSIDIRGEDNEYDLVFTCSDLVVPKNIRHSRIILIQEGMTDPENFFYYMVRYFSFPRWIASTSTTGLSDAYDLFFVASEGYRDLFLKKGVKPYKIKVTGIPNFDNVRQYTENNFPYNDYLMVATSDCRETFKYENRKKTIMDALKIADGRQLLFKFHPNENHSRAAREVEKYAPGAIHFSEGNTNHMIANSSVLITKFSTVVFTGIALGKEVYSDFDIEFLKRLTPIQNGGKSAENIAGMVKSHMYRSMAAANTLLTGYRQALSTH